MYLDQVFLILTKMCGWWKDDLCALCIIFSSQEDIPHRSLEIQTCKITELQYDNFSVARSILE